MYIQSPTYDQILLRKIPIQTIIKMPLKFYFELHFKLYAQTQLSQCPLLVQWEDYLFESPSTCQRLYIYLISPFQLYDKVLRTHPI